MCPTTPALEKYVAKSASRRAIGSPPQPISVWPVLVSELAAAGPPGPDPSAGLSSRRAHAAVFPAAPGTALLDRRSRRLTGTLCSALYTRHSRSYERDDFVFDPIHYLPLLEYKTGALDQAAPLAGWELPEEFGVLRRLLESRMGRRGKREFVQVLRLMFELPDAGGIRRRTGCPQARRRQLRRRQAPGVVQDRGSPSETRPRPVPPLRPRPP